MGNNESKSWQAQKPNSYTFSFEIEPKFSKYFFRDIPNLTFMQKAVWIEDGTTKFYRDKKKLKAGGSLLFEKTSKNLNKKKPIIVETIVER